MARERSASTDSTPNEDARTAPAKEEQLGGFSRRAVLGWCTAAVAATTSLRATVEDSGIDDADDLLTAGGLRLREATLADLQAAMASGELTALSLTRRYLSRIRRFDQDGPGVNSVIEVNPDAESIARTLDSERRTAGPRGPLHGIPVLLKDNIDTGDRMQTTAGSLALAGTPALQDATVSARLRAAGAVILGKANLSEWANFRGFASSSGWSGRGGQVRNPYILDRNPCGSSSGSAAAVSSNFCAAALGTETDGSIVCPASACGVVGIKPTVGLTSRAGVVPISHTQDTVGPHARTIADAAAVLGALTGVDPRDPATAASAGRSYADYTQFLDPNGLVGARIGVDARLTGFSTETDEVFFAALDAMMDAGAEIVDIEIPNLEELFADDAEIVVLVREFKQDLNAYLATRTGVPVADMADVIAFNQQHVAEELPYFGQEWFELAEGELFSEQEYLDALQRGPRLAGPEGLDAAIEQFSLDAIVAPTGSPAWPIDLLNGDAFLGGSSSHAAVAGYPLISMPAGLAFGLPVGISFMAGAYSEPLLIRLASGFEAATRLRSEPDFRQTFQYTGDEPGGVLPAHARRQGERQTLSGRKRARQLANRLLRPSQRLRVPHL